jgi:hypothetical protein
VRIRQVKPAFWSDAKLADLPESTRLFYIGTWMLADDAGWMRWDPVEAAKELYGFDSRTKREKRVREMYDQLVTAGRLESHECGHTFIPKLDKHQRLASPEKQVRTVEREHRLCLRTPAGNGKEPAGTRDRPRIPGTERNGKGRSVEVRNGTPALTREDERRELLDSFRRRGLPVDAA